MRGVVLLRVRPSEKTVTTVTRGSITPDVIAQLCGTKDLRAVELGCLSFHRGPELGSDDFPICAVHRRWDFPYGLMLPRWRFKGLPIVHGEAILFGRNAQGKAAETPVTSMQAFDAIEWLPPMTQEPFGENYGDQAG